jgi:hypothetical protein
MARRKEKAPGTKKEGDNVEDIKWDNVAADHGPLSKNKSVHSPGQNG